MHQNQLRRCTVCGAPIYDHSSEASSATTVRENDKEITLVHCPRCATLLVRVREQPAPVR